MIKSGYIFALAAFASQAVAEAPVILWQNLTVGMSKAEVTALYPTGKVNLTPECEAKIDASYTKGTLSRVALKFGDLMAAGKSAWEHGLECQKIVRASIISRYGEPAESGRRTDFHGVETGDKLLWSNGNVVIDFYAQDHRPFTVIQYIYNHAPEKVNPSAANNL